VHAGVRQFQAALQRVRRKGLLTARLIFAEICRAPAANKLLRPVSAVRRRDRVLRLLSAERPVEENFRARDIKKCPISEITLFNSGLNSAGSEFFHDHDHEEDPALIPAAEPAHAPAINVIPYRRRRWKPQELRLHASCFPTNAWSDICGHPEDQAVRNHQLKVREISNQPPSRQLL